MFIDADARMDTYEDKDGVKRTQLNLLMRTIILPLDSQLLHAHDELVNHKNRQFRSAQSSSESRHFDHRRWNSDG